MLEKDGIPTADDLKKVLPSEERLAKGPVVIVECFEEIPCDPCHYSCNRGAIKEFKDINALPEVNHDYCNGCSICIYNCPGLAVFVLDANYSQDQALLKIPYEFASIPQSGEKVILLDRGGQEVGIGEVQRVQNIKAQAKTAIISLLIPKKLMHQVRHFKRKEAD